MTRDAISQGILEKLSDETGQADPTMRDLWIRSRDAGLLPSGLIKRCCLGFAHDLTDLAP